MRLAGIAATAMGLFGAISATPHQALELLEASYPADFVKRQVLNACIAYDLALDRFNSISRDECYRALPKQVPEQGRAQVGLTANQIDLGRTAHLAGAPRNDIGLLEATEAVRSGISR
jgi:hypothetical protein